MTALTDVPAPYLKELSLSRPLPQSTPRHHAHSISLGAVNHNHRVTRRKSVTTTAAANAAAAVAASMKDTNGEPIGVPMPSHRRSSTRRGLESTSVGAPSGFGHYLSRSMNSPSQEPAVARKPSPNHSNIGASSVAAAGGEESSSDNKPVNTKSRNRRASEGSHLIKGEGKRALAELRCDRCGKGYKHGSCLSKHMCVYSPPKCHPAAWIESEQCAMSALLQGRPRGHAAPLVSPDPFPPPLRLSLPSWRFQSVDACGRKSLGGNMTRHGPLRRSS